MMNFSFSEDNENEDNNLFLPGEFDDSGHNNCLNEERELFFNKLDDMKYINEKSYESKPTGPFTHEDKEEEIEEIDQFTEKIVHFSELKAIKQEEKIESENINNNKIENNDKNINNLDVQNNKIEEEIITKTQEIEDTSNIILNKRIIKTKFEDDNTRRRIKNILLDEIKNFINKQIIKLYNNKIGQGILKKELKPLNQKQKSNGNIEESKEFIRKSVGEIFSDDITGRITNFPKDHNKKLIEKLLNEENIIIKNYFNDLFKITFFQCLEHFRGTKYYTELNGMRKMNDVINNEEEGYKKHLQYYFMNYETIINNKKSRYKRKKIK